LLQSSREIGERDIPTEDEVERRRGYLRIAGLERQNRCPHDALV
jgi:hypothetical protein